MLLPTGSTLPPLPHLVVVLAAAGLVAWGLYRESPPVTDRSVVAFAPWMVVGSSLYVAYQVDLVAGPARPFLGSPTVYLTTFAVAGTLWLAVRRLTDDDLLVLGVAGGLLAAALAGAVLRAVAAAGTLALRWPAIGLAVAVVLGAATWVVARRYWPEATAPAGAAGALVVFAHALDGVSTAVGVDALDFGEQTPLSRVILEIAAGLPTATALGVGWLFVLVKLALAVVVVALVADYVREEPTEGNLLYALVAAVGLGPGAHNLLLFAIAG